MASTFAAIKTLEPPELLAGLDGVPPECQGYNPYSLADRMKKIVSAAGLNIHQISQASRRPPYSELSSAYFIPHTLCCDLRRGELPHICQVAALSAITNFDFTDWLAVLGHDPHVIQRLQVRLHSNRTILLSGPFDSIPGPDPIAAPSDDGLRETSQAPVQSRFRYMKIGLDDKLSRSFFVPGSIVRIDSARNCDRQEAENLIHAVEHCGALMCCRTRHVVRARKRAPALDLENRLEEVSASEAHSLGIVDNELRPLSDTGFSQPDRDMRLPRRPSVDGRFPCPRSLSQLLRGSRERLGLRLRDAQKLTREVADILGDSSYAISLGALSDYEASDAVPRHIAKIFSLCIIYAIDLYRLLRIAGVHLPSGRQSRIPGISQTPDDTVMQTLRARSAILGLNLNEGKFSAQDLYFFRQRDPILHPSFDGARIVVVDRRRRNIGEQCKVQGLNRPQYMLLSFSGRYLCGAFSREHGSLVLYPESGGAPAIRFPELNTEIIGRILFVERELLPPINVQISNSA